MRDDNDGSFEPFKLVVGLYGIWARERADAFRPSRESGRNGALKHISSEDAAAVRHEAVQRIQTFAGVTVVAGHCSFPKSADTHSVECFEDVFTEADGKTYSAIAYLDVAANIVSQQRRDDEVRSRPKYDASFLDQWMCHEKELLEAKCEEYGIDFEMVQPDDLLNCIADRIVHPWIESVLERSKVALERAVARVPSADVYLMIDGDRTFTPMDTGRAFFGAFCDRTGKNFPSDGFDSDVDPLKQVFSRHPDYCPQAFVEAAMLYTSIGSQEDYKSVSREVGLSRVHPYDPWLRFLSNLPARVHPILISCSNRDIWVAALEREGLMSQNGSSRGPNMSLIAGNHLGLHSYIVDIEAKGQVVSWLRQLHPGCKVFAFGDSILDKRMMEASDRSYVVLDGERRNRSLQPFLAASINARKPTLFQISPRNDAEACWYHDGIPVASLRGLLQELTDGSIFATVNLSSVRRSATILAAQTRRADLPPPSLQVTHEQVGRFLADAILDEFSFDETLFEESQFDHVQGTSFSGCVAKSSDAVILALMRGGEPMARGLFAKLPSATFVHYWNDDQPLDFAKDRCCSVRRIYVVDSVINRGDSVRRVLRRLEDAAASSSSRSEGSRGGRWAVYVVSGVIQEAAATALPREFPRVRFVTLRVSSNQYSGSGGTDTGNRLFGTL